MKCKNCNSEMLHGTVDFGQRVIGTIFICPNAKIDILKNITPQGAIYCTSQQPKKEG